MKNYPDCDQTRYGKSGVLRCPHGCVTECARLRQAANSSQVRIVRTLGGGRVLVHDEYGPIR